MGHTLLPSPEAFGLALIGVEVAVWVAVEVDLGSPGQKSGGLVALMVHAVHQLGIVYPVPCLLVEVLSLVHH